MDRGGEVTVGSWQPHAVQVVSSTWARDSHDLFDFEAHHLHTKTFSVLSSMVCVRNGTDVQMMREHTSMPVGSEPLLRLVQKDGYFWVDKVSPSSSSKKLWLVVRDSPPGGHNLAEGDVMKLGRFKFKVRQFGVHPGSQPELRLDDSGAVCCPEGKGHDDLSQTLCRICLLEGSTEEDPLITPCQCKGSIEFVHLGCLRHWIRGRLNLAENAGGGGPGIGSYFYRPLACELCKAFYPTYVSSSTSRSPLVEVPQTTPPFIVLENLVRDSQQHATRGLHVISLGEKVLKLGRGHESDVRIADVSISRCHAMIRFQRGHFVLEDNDSKFGTLVAMKKPRLLEPGKTVSIQMGRTVICLQVQPDHGFVGSPPLLSLPSSSHNERALRLALLTRGSTQRADVDPHNASTPPTPVGPAQTWAEGAVHQQTEAVSGENVEQPDPLD
ncbi:unnamed protein product [Polarella glacialis]|uniref:RING-CH-type domain-containing protein n=1 Tax=Polarella glacialis TaxID=89957 RepID=A0A813HCQ4_POLGL|nr:unnamed protein product [Polarella glacialis]